MSESADEIMNALRRCKTVPEVNETAQHYRKAVEVMAADPELRERAIHIKNLAAYMRLKLMGRLRDKPR